MKHLIVIFVCVFYSMALLWAQSGSSLQLSIQPESKLWFEGTSTLHDYSCTATEISGSIHMDSTQIENAKADPSKLFHQATIMIPVQKLTSGNKKLDDNMYEALKADDYPNISYKLLDVTTISDSVLDKGIVLIQTRGKLSVAGKENVIDMNLEVIPDSESVLRVRGSKELFMTDFGIEPPTMMLGLLKTENRVVVYFDLQLRLQQAVQQQKN